MHRFPALLCPALFLLSVALFPANAVAQPKAGKARIDSLTALLPALPDDTTKANVLYAISRTALDIRNTDTGLLYARQDSALCAKIGWKKGLANALNMMGNQLTTKFDYVGAIPAYEKGLAISETIGDTLTAYRIESNLGNAYMQLAQYPKALEWQQKALAHAEVMHNESGKISSLNLIGMVYQRQNEYAKAISTFEQGLQAADAMGKKADKQMVIRFRGNIAMSYATQGAYEKALETFAQLLKQLEKDGLMQTGFAPATYLNMSGVYNEQNQYAKGIEYAEKAIAAASPLGDSSTIMKAVANASSSYSSLGDNKKAMQTTQQVVDWNRRTNNKPEVARNLLNLSTRYTDAGDFKEALHIRQQSLALWREVGDKKMEAAALGNIGLGYYNLEKRTEANAYYDSAIALSRSVGDTRGLIGILINRGAAYLTDGAYPKALEYQLAALRLADSLNDKNLQSAALSNMANLYSEQKDYPKATAYRQRALELSTAINYKYGISNALRNLAYYALSMGDTSAALGFARRAVETGEGGGSLSELGYSYHRLGGILRDTRQYDAALHQFKSGAAIFRQIGKRGGIADNQDGIGLLYYAVFKDSAYKPATGSPLALPRQALLARAADSLQAAAANYRAAGAIKGLQEILEELSEVQASAGAYKEAMEAFKEHITLRDSIYTKDKDRAFIRTELDYASRRAQDSIRFENDKRALALQKEAALAALRYEFERKQAGAKGEAERTAYRNEEALRRQQIIDEHNYTQAFLESKRQREAAIAKAEGAKRDAIAAAELKRRQSLVYASYAGGGLLLIGAVVALLAYRGKRRASGIIAAERERSEALLRNILPADIAEELKREGTAAARQYDSVSVLFTDFVNFSGASEKLSPQALVQELHECFSAFDEICERHGLEKIKTIGDAYMAVCGLPGENARHAQACTAAAIDVRDFMQARGSFGIRIGIHSGPVVAGVVGTDKYAYDVWGDTVNTASRMEQSGEPGRINISAATYALIRQDYPCTYRGELAAKGKGELAMYFVEASATQKAIQTA